VQTAPRHALARVQLLREDPGLCEAIPLEQQPWAIEHCIAAAMTVMPGSWQPEDLGLDPRAIGALVLDGLLLRRVGIDGRFGAELLGEGDLLQPGEGVYSSSTMASTTRWRIITRSRVALLTGPVAERLARYPSLTGALTGRALARARRLSMMLAIVHHPRVEVRLHMLLWHLADRWGRVRGDGVFLPLGLSHSVLADLIVAQRPSVTGGLKKLVERGSLKRFEDGWLLCGEPPVELLELQ